MVELQPVDAVEVTLVVDDVDILAAGAEGVRRFPLAYDFSAHEQLVAEHGFSALVTVESGGRAWRERKVTFPTGAELHLPPPSRADLEAVNVLHNARRLTGRDRIVGFVGGFHLTGAAFEAISVGTTPRF